VSTDIAHDLKTPLNRLGISLEEARRKLARGQSAEDEIDAADAEVQQINGTSEALLRIAQIE
jgi:signal transduction histidine kinase